MANKAKQKSVLNNVFIKVRKNFSRSTNLKLDFQDTNSLKHLIVSEKFQRNFNNICSPLTSIESNQRVHVISGTPGVGKSTFSVFVARCLSKGKNKKLDTVIKTQAKTLTSEFKRNYKKVSGENYLPVFLNGDEGEIEDAFHEALKSSFADFNLADEFKALSEKYSVRAFDIIATWKRNYPLKFEEFKIFVENEYVEGYDKFIKSLKQNRRNSQKFFSRAYRQITGGASVGSYRHGQVVNLYKNAISILNKKKFSGIVIVYDEFGKYLERGVRQPSDFDLQFLQDIAELCNNGQNAHIHLLLITHLPISQYAAQLPVSIQQEWAKIEGRFEQSSFNSGYESSYTILGSVFESNIKSQSPKVWRNISTLSKEWVSKNSPTNNFSDVFRTKGIEKSISESFPLHPSVFCLLPLLSEKVAQNERTMFSFLTRDEEFSLPWFLKRKIISEEESDYIGPYNLYSYFRSLIANDIGIGGACKIGLIIDDVLNSLDSSEKCEKDIMALLGIATIINNRSVFRITSKSADAVLFGIYNNAEVKSAIKSLEKSKSIIFDRIKGEYILFEGSSIDLREEINKVRQTKLTTSGYIDILKKNFDLNFVIPKKYNFESGITRYFREEIISAEELEAGNLDVDYSKEDGKVYYVVPFSRGELKNIKNILDESNIESSIFIVTNKPLEIEPELLELHAIEQIYSKKEILSSGTTVRKELNHYRESAKEIIRKSLKKIRSNIHMDVTVSYRGGVLSGKVNRLLEIANYASFICDEEFSSYPTFFNEMINKHKASIPVIQGRIRLLNSFENCHLKRYGIEGGGAEFSLYKALLKSNSFSFTNNDDGTKKISGLRKKSALTPLYEDFVSFLGESEKTPMPMMELIERWRKPPFGIRLPLIPIYINLFSRMTSSPMSYFHEEVFIGKVDIELFENLIKKPKKYSLRRVQLDKKKLNYLKEVGNSFNKIIPGNSKIIENNFIEVAKLISRYYSLVPSFTRRNSQLNTRQKKLIAQLDIFKQPEQFILVDLPTVYTQKEFNKLSKLEINDFVKSLDSDLDKIFNTYIGLISNIADIQKLHLLKLRDLVDCKSFKTVEKGAPLAKYWKKILDALSDDVLTFPYSEKTLMLVNRIVQLNESANNQSVVENLADALTGSNPKSWSEKGLSLFKLNLRMAVSEIEQINYLKSQDNSRLVTISSFDNSGKPSIKEILKSEIDCNEYSKIIGFIRQKIEKLGNSEKNTILLELLNEINSKKFKPTKVTNKSTIGQAWG